jgi:transposase
VQISVALLRRVVEAMWEDAKANARWICIDATGVLVFAKEKCSRHHFWVLVAERHHVLFRYTKTHDGLVPAKLLEGYRGYVLADASAVYHELYRREPGITECGCWSHARRGAFEALSSDQPRALVIIGFIGLLYDAHRLATDPKTGVTDGAKRKADAKPVIDKLYAWIEAERPKVADEAPIAKAMNYLVNHRVPLTRFLDDGILRLDNNLSELELRREKVGAHNWLYCGSDDGAHWNAAVVSLIASCQLHGIEPWAYLRDVLTLLPSWPVKRVLALAPKYWNETRQQLETEQRLASLRLLGRNDVSHATEATAAT